MDHTEFEAGGNGGGGRQRKVARVWLEEPTTKTPNPFSYYYYYYHCYHTFVPFLMGKMLKVPRQEEERSITRERRGGS